MSQVACPICGSPRLFHFLRRDQIPVHQNRIMVDRREALSVPRGRIEMTACDHCGFIFNGFFDSSLLTYGKDYENTQSYSPCFSAYLDGLIEDLVERHGVRKSTVVEVGCGQGYFLHKLVAYPGANNRGLGFDPSYTGPDIALEGRLEFRRRYFDHTCSDVVADVVVCRHVIEHVPDPIPLLRSVRTVLKNSHQARAFFETPCVEWILRNRVVWDFFYEHCSLFSPSSLRLAFECAGFAVVDLMHTFSGQYLWLEAQIAEDPIPAAMPTPHETAALARSYGDQEAEIRHKWHSRFLDLARQGKTALWGAGAKGATLAHLVDPDAVLIDCVVDLNPNKQGHFIPGSGHRIVAPTDLPKRGIRSAVLTNPNYHAETRRLLIQAGIELDLITGSEG